jgi:hypothetical protein
MPIRFCTYNNRNRPPIRITIIDAMMATCAAQPHFDPVSVGESYQRRTYLSGPSSYMNPIREIIAEAYSVYPEPDKQHIAGLVSLGAGYPGIIAAPARGDGDKEWIRTLQRILDDCDQTAREISRHMSRLVGIYYRFSAAPGFENQRNSDDVSNIGLILAQTSAYCETDKTTRLMKDCINSLQSCAGITTLDQLSQYDIMTSSDDLFDIGFRSLWRRVFGSQVLASYYSCLCDAR